jgi:hypothetical protein
MSCTSIESADYISTLLPCVAVKADLRVPFPVIGLFYL